MILGVKLGHVFVNNCEVGKLLNKIFGVLFLNVEAPEKFGDL